MMMAVGNHQGLGRFIYGCCLGYDGFPAHGHGNRGGLGGLMAKRASRAQLPNNTDFKRLYIDKLRRI